MKKLLIALLLLTLIGCGKITTNDYSERIEDLEKQLAENDNRIDNLNALLEHYVTEDNLRSTLDSQFAEFYSEIEDNLKVDIEQSCDIDLIFMDLMEIVEQMSDQSYKYTFQIDENGNLLEFRYGVYTETFTLQDFYDYYCVID